MLLLKILSATLIVVPNVFAGRADLERVAKESSALNALVEKFDQFDAAMAYADKEFRLLRQLVKRNETRMMRTLAARIQKEGKRIIEIWGEINSIHQKANKQSLHLDQQKYTEFLKSHRSLMYFLKYQRNNRFRENTSLAVFIGGWRALDFGERIATPPQRRITTLKIGDHQLTTTTTLIIHTVNGGFIRGRVEGFTEDGMVIREVLPLPLVHIVKHGGHYRIVKFQDAAQIEIFQLPPGHTAQDSVPPVINGAGQYNSYYVQPELSFKLTYQLTDMELLRRILEGKDIKLKSRTPSSEPIHFQEGTGPSLGDTFIVNCRSELAQ